MPNFCFFRHFVSTGMMATVDVMTLVTLKPLVQMQ